MAPLFLHKTVKEIKEYSRKKKLQDKFDFSEMTFKPVVSSNRRNSNDNDNDNINNKIINNQINKLKLDRSKINLVYIGNSPKMNAKANFDTS